MPRESQNINLLTKRWRAITYNYPLLAVNSDVSRMYCLTDFQVAWLMSNLDYYSWRTRWVDQNATDTELNEQQAELEYRLMTCVDLQPWQIVYLYDVQVSNQLTLFETLYDSGGIPELNEDTPTDFYSGDDSQDRLDALCTACNIYVRSYAQNWVAQAQIALGIAQVVGIAASIFIVGGVIAGVLLAGLALITQVALDAMQDEEALDDVVCCMNNALQSAVVNESNFQDSLDSCGFEAGSNAAIVRDIVASDLGQFDNWLSFLNALGNSFVLAENGVTSCPCVEGWDYIETFPLDWGAYTLFDFGAAWFPTTAGKLGLVAGLDGTAIEYLPLDRYFNRIKIETNFDESTVTSISVTYIATVEGNPNSRIVAYFEDVEVADVTWEITNTGGLPVTKTLVLDDQVDEILLDIVFAFKQDSHPSANGEIVSAVIEGTGIKPPQFS